ncbi:Uncharacterised protein [Serratia ficaria]|nr:hypothetical protein [Serratia ficaria]CAI2123635.1 Uncharacterised protein [Serratia ficaria]
MALTPQVWRRTAYLTRSSWAEGIDRDTVRLSIANSLCFGLFDGDGQIGFARPDIYRR